MAATITFSSCIGSFGLFNKVLDWNKGISNKFVNEIVFLLISPAYAVCGVVDLLVLNTVEFWSGSNPIAKVGHVEKVWGQDGRQYAVKTLKDGYEVTKPTGEKRALHLRQGAEELVDAGRRAGARAVPLQRGWNHPGRTPER